MVHNDATLSDVEKFQHLLANIDGEPLSICQNYHLSAENYQLVFQALKNRYDSKRLLIAHLVNSVVSFKQEKFDLKQYLQVHQGTKLQLEKLNLTNLFENFYYQICYANLPYWLQ